MSFGLSRSLVSSHIADLEHLTPTARDRPTGTRQRRGLRAPTEKRLRSRLGLVLIEAGLHLLPKATTSLPPIS
ncbi:MAG TPA: hypothetical protein VG298_06790 [Acidimicrobiales bacterium]|jgi:hypothetical protein|nr:hypothetical protein [Acidimicrobiales bacterium]